METGYLNFHDEEHFSDFSLTLGQHNLLDDSESSLLPIDDDFDYVESRLDTSGGLWGTEQELNGDMAVLPVSGVASVIPKIENMKEDFAKVLTDWQEHIGYLQASDMGEDIDMAELSMAIPEKLNTDLPEEIFHNEIAAAQANAHSSPIKKPVRDSAIIQTPKCKTISESSSQEIDVIGLDLNEDLEPELDLIDIDCDQANSLSGDIDYELLDAARGKSEFDLASYITGNGEEEENESVEPEYSSKTSDDNLVENLHAIKQEMQQEAKKAPEIVVEPKKVEKVATSKNSIAAIKMEKSDKQSSDNEDCIDVETVTAEQMPVLEAGDVKSLLEQFEASEASAIGRPTGRNKKRTLENGNPPRINQPSNKTRDVDQSKQTLLKKSIETQDSKFHKNIRDSLPKEVIDRIKASARKKVISGIPALSNAKVSSRNNGTRIQEAAATLSRTKLLKIVANSSSGSTGRVDGSVQLDHDYCSSSNSISGSSEIRSSNNSNGGGGNGDGGMAEIVPISDPNSSKNSNNYLPINSKNSELKSRNNSSSKSETEVNSKKRSDRWMDCGSRKDSGLESGDVSDASEEPASILPSAETNEPRNSVAAKSKKTSPAGNSSRKNTNSSSPSEGNSCNSNAAAKGAPVYEMKIRSALATSILQLRKGVITKTKSLESGGNKGKQMVSVLKKPPIATQTSVVAANPNESIVTTKNSSNDEVQNIIVQETTKTTQQRSVEVALATNIVVEESKKTQPRRKLNLAEYRSRREQTRSGDNSRTCSPVQPMTLVYVHHASTTTEPVKDDPYNPVWSEREIVSVLKPKIDIEEEKNREKPATREMAIQTNETVFDCPTRIEEDETEVIKIAETDTETRVTRMRDRKNRRYRQRRSSSSSSRSRSRSRSRSQSRSRGETRSRSRNRSRSRGSRSESNRSRSRRCSSNPRRRRISHRRSSVSSSSSWSSRSRSHTRSTSRSRSRSRSRSLRSRSRSSRSRSRSRSSSRYSSCSRSSSRSNFGRSKWSGGRRRRRGRRERRTNYDDRYRRGSSGSSHGHRGWRRSTSYRRQYETWYEKEKKRQMEERRVIYVGRLDENITKLDLRRRFEAFGPVLDISVHFREHGDNYGFVTFAYKNDAYEAVEHGNDDPALPRYDLSFGGRRAFCKVKYADLDGMASSSLNSGVTNTRSIIKSDEDNTFDLLLKEAKAKLRKRKV